MWKNSGYSTLFERLNSSPSSKICGVAILSWISLLLSVSCLPGPTDFCYDETYCGPSNWGDTCAYGTLQSPINLEHSTATKIKKSTSLILNRDYATPQTFHLMNNGHTVKLYINDDGSSPCKIMGSGFLPNEPYIFNQLHFHWGPSDFTGSEHLINGKAFPLELHMIHQQASDGNKLAVLGILFKISEYDNPALTPILNNLNLVKNPSANPVQVPSSSLINLKNLLPKKVKLFRYHGSLTTPPCSEGIIWSVFDDFQTVSRSQINQLRQLLRNDQRPIRTNFRPVQQAFTGKRKNIYYMKSLT